MPTAGPVALGAQSVEDLTALMTSAVWSAEFKSYRSRTA
jgi:hypothetical protein